MKEIKIYITAKISNNNKIEEKKRYVDKNNIFVDMLLWFQYFKKNNIDSIYLDVEGGKRCIHAVFERVRPYNIGKRVKYNLSIEGHKYNMRNITEGLWEIAKTFKEFIINDEKLLNENPVIL